jgi:hypothetical protein
VGDWNYSEAIRVMNPGKTLYLLNPAVPLSVNKESKKRVFFLDCIASRAGKKH